MICLNRFVHNVELEWYKSHHVTSVDDISTVCLMCNESVQVTNLKSKKIKFLIRFMALKTKNTVINVVTQI